jgi:hypothetical protein
LNKLKDSIHQLYEAFADIAKPQNIDGCPCCIDEKNISTLFSTPLRSISSDDLSAYASSAFNTVGDVPDYLYFLPRILEISATDNYWYPDVEITGRAICTTEPTSWSAIRYNALTKFLTSTVDAKIEEQDYHQLDEWLCAIAKMELNLHSFLEQVENSPSAVLGYFDRNAECLSKGKLCNSFWERPSEGHDIIIQWFKAEPVRKILFDAYGYVND